ncbi:MAG TPA: mersacidin/lichenicidin family type 2 lantibiotic [Solirubrobacteraceae bacterium]|nr:mersacidin/lichenicidin family type 2 lantibiotic [Solirubrobacteraceae bacterium]
MTEMADARARRVIARAWRDESFRDELPTEVRDTLPPPPDGVSQMSDEELEAAAGGTTPGCVAAGIAVGGVALGYGISEIVD